MSIFSCPRCGEGKLFAGLLKVAPACSVCDLSFSKHEQGDGPAVFAILIVSALTAIFAAVVEIQFEPPFWVHAVLWVPLVIGGSIFSLRVLKAALIRAQYKLKPEDFK